MVIQCRVWNMQEGYKVNILRFHNGRIESITSEESYLRSSLESRVFLSTRNFPDRTHVYILTLVDVSYNDQGKYSCSVEHVSEDGTTTIAMDKVMIKIHSFPNIMYPACDSVPRQPITLYQGNKLVLSCSSENGIPTAELIWSCTQPDISIISRNTSTTAMVSSEITLISDISYHGTVFTCHLSSQAFPNRERTCNIGPITILSTESTAENVDITQSLVPNVAKDQNVKQNTLEGAGCSSQCSPEDEEIVLYLIISTMGASILCILFLTTTIMFCYKYHSISTDAIEVRRKVPGNDGSEPVYVSLQRRQEYDRNSICSTYMTVEDPSNPGSKVLMPKEVFDEFYRTLTIKRV